MTDIVERLRAAMPVDQWSAASDPCAEAADEIERLRATVEWQRRALQINAEEIEQPRAELARVTRERDAALDALAKAAELKLSAWEKAERAWGWGGDINDD